MAFLSQASHLGSVLLPHDAFQEHAAHVVEWSTTLRSKGSESTCIRSGLTTFLHYAFSAHPNYVVECGIAHRKPPDVRICRWRNQSAVGTRPPSTATPHCPACLPRR